MRPEIFGIPIDPLTRDGFVEQVREAIRTKRHLLVATVNTEWLMRTLRDPTFRELLLQADLRTADGSGILWAATFLSLPWRGPLWSIWQMIYSGASLTLYPRFCRRVLPELLPGSQLAPQLAEMGQKEGWRIFLLGAGPGVAEKVASQWQGKFAALQIATSDADPDQDRALPLIREFRPDIIMVAYTAPDQLVWVKQHQSKLPPFVGIGIGGTLDYIAGTTTVRVSGVARLLKAHRPPRLVSSLGLEWLWRLLTQPWRLPRTSEAVPKFIINVLQYRSDLATRFKSN